MHSSKLVRVVHDHYLLQCAANCTIDYLFKVGLLDSAQEGKITSDVRKIYMHFIVKCLLYQLSKQVFSIVVSTETEQQNELTRTIPQLSKSVRPLLRQIQKTIPHRFFTATDGYYTSCPLNQLPGHWIDKIYTAQAKVPKSLQKFKKLIKRNQLNSLDQQLAEKFDIQKLLLTC